MMSLWDALRMNMMISYQELVRTFLRITLGTDRPWSGVEEKELPCKVLASPYFILFID